MSSFFVTATGTDVGKTFVTAGLLRELLRSGRQAMAVKPVMSGYDPAGAASSDAGILLRAMDRSVTAESVAEISPWRFKAALSPDMAARSEGTEMDFDALVEFSRDAVACAPDVSLIEGAGGLMSPVTDNRTMLDWIVALDMEVILVAGSYLGTISHSLSALEVLRNRNLKIRALVVSESADSTVGLDDTVAAIARFAACKIIGLPRLRDNAIRHPSFEKLARLLG